MIKLLVLDCDNTLLTSERTISAKNKEALKDLKENYGVPIILASGRGNRGMEHLIVELGLENNPHIANNGANIFRMGEEVKATCLFDRDEYNTIVDYFHENGIDFMVFEKDYLVYDTAEDEIEPIRKYLGNTNFYERDPKGCKEPFKIGSYYRDQREREIIMNFPAKTMDLHQADLHFIDIHPKGVSKLIAVESVAKELGIDLAEIASAGDNENDVPMLEGVGLSFAVGNAVPQAKAAATHVLEQTNDEDAIYHLVYDYLIPELSHE